MSKKPVLTEEEFKEYFGTPVAIYFNLHTHLWSVKNRKTGRVMFHTLEVAVNDAKYTVSEAGRQRVLKEKRKNVHAAVHGILCSRYDVLPRNSIIDVRRSLISYNPYKGPDFIHKDSGIPIHSSRGAVLIRNGNQRNVFAI